ncbi:hypothetical protein A3K55_00665 [Candidatus Shapirobacteria bacterium RBG_13_44_7]|uniref:Peptidyl-prolyl cis-trans isomerase n=1 Tax=Candidatus Shapirobacteria bacterium RBG_13_44_7 TaxID=1802149 RepID=A0A1F7SEN0_9BACT|nr:MAG: hypothetical protein A3K55_00665 [Candidatus Shapirobacteria bacterium RBG_13_44_7]
MIKFLIPLATALLFSACSLFPKSSPSTSEVLPNTSPSVSTPSTKSTPAPLPTVITLKTKYGPIAIKLYLQDAPNTTQNFIQKVNSGFYNKLKFHRVEPGFVVQGGDPLGNGTGGGKIASEINDIPFKRGSVGLARGQIKVESNDSQFFICLNDLNCQHLTSEYVNFGEVVSGMEFVDQIQVGDQIIEMTPYTK